MASLPERSRLSIHVGVGDYTDAERKMGWLTALPTFLEALTTVAPECLTQLLTEGIAFAQFLNEIPRQDWRLDEIEAYAQIWANQWRLNAQWASLVAKTTINAAVEAERLGQDPPSCLMYGSPFDPESVRLRGHQSGHIVDLDEIRRQTSIETVLPALLIRYSPLVDRWADIESELRAQFERVVDAVKSDHQKVVARMELRQTDRRAREHFEWLARFLAGNGGRGESISSIDRNRTEGGSQKSPNLNFVRKRIRECAKLLDLTLPENENLGQRSNYYSLFMGF